MALTDLDSYYVKGISSLHSFECISNDGISILQTNLEEAIKSKTGNNKDLSALIATAKQQRLEDFKPLGIEESKTTSSSDNELELDLFKDDLMCIVCNGMDVGARNRLLECFDCHSLYHQECHRPVVTSQDMEGVWICQNCKDINKKKSTPVSGPSPTSTKPVVKASQSLLKTSNATSTYKTSHYKNNGSSQSKPSSSSSKSSSKNTSSLTKGSVTPNINIISADKRIQIMKKKAAKLHEKRKLPR